MDQKWRGISLKPFILTKPHVWFAEGLEKRKAYRRLGKGFS
jgi:hypothetical protein